MQGPPLLKIAPSPSPVSQVVVMNADLQRQIGYLFRVSSSDISPSTLRNYLSKQILQAKVLSLACFAVDAAIFTFGSDARSLRCYKTPHDHVVLR